MKRCVNLALSEELVQLIDAQRSTDQGEVPRSAFVENELRKALKRKDDGDGQGIEPRKVMKSHAGPN